MGLTFNPLTSQVSPGAAPTPLFPPSPQALGDWAGKPGHISGGHWALGAPRTPKYETRRLARPPNPTFYSPGTLYSTEHFHSLSLACPVSSAVRPAFLSPFLHGWGLTGEPEQVSTPFPLACCYCGSPIASFLLNLGELSVFTPLDLAAFFLPIGKKTPPSSSKSL